MENIRCRIAPSPTGDPHVGTAYIALMNICYARKYDGKFILRIEDTDQSRSTTESEQQIFDSLKWLGLHWDEGPDIGGPYGPYRQSERLSIYKEHIQHLIQNRSAYHCFCTAEDLETLRKQQTELKQPPGYFGRNSPCRALTPEQVEEKLASGQPYVIRLAVPLDEGNISFHDEIRKENISRQYREIDDQILIKSDGFPTYHLASVVDDHLMEITHVIRGEEWINSTYKHVLLYQAFGWTPPRFFHLGLLRNPDANKTKISKRKNPVSLNWFRAAGYYAPALVNFLGLMGYSRYRESMSDDEKKTCEYFSLQTMISDFDENRISSTGAAFDFDKLEEINFQYISKLEPGFFVNYLNERNQYLLTYFGPFIDLFLSRFTRAEKDITYWSAFLFKSKLNYDRAAFANLGEKDFKVMSKHLTDLKKMFNEQLEQLRSPESIRQLIQDACLQLNISSKLCHMLLRVVVTGSSESLPLYESIHLLGIYRTMQRLDEGAQFLKSLR